MFEKIIETIKSASKIAIFTHTNPDGDAMGSSYSLKLALKAIGKRAEVYLEDGYETAAWSLIRGKESDGLEFSDCDLAVALDCGDVFRLGSHEDDFLKFDNSIAIDHHITHKEFAKSGTVIENISSTCELIYGLYVEMEISVDTDIANNLYIGLISDTGNFKYSSVTSKTHIVAANLIDSGVNFANISKVLFDTKSMGYLNLMKMAIEKLDVYLDGCVAVLHLAESDFENAGISEQGAVGIVTLPISIKGVQVGVYIRTRANGEYKVSLRSNNTVDVAAIADYFGGGGHVCASGYTAKNTTVEEITGKVLTEIKKLELR